MVMTDPIADMLTRIRNAIMAGHGSLELNHSGIKEEIAKILKKEGFIEGYNVTDITERKKKIVLFLRQQEKKNLITGLIRVSKPGRRIYSNYKEIPSVLNGYGIVILSTSKGVLTDRECRKQKVGGEIICYVW